MPELISRMARCSSVASLNSTIRSTLPSAARTMRPYALASDRRDDGDGRAAACVLLCERDEGLALQQRDVAHRHEDGARQVGGEGVEAALGGPARPLDLVLVGDGARGVDRGDVLGDAVTLVADDDGDVLGARGAGRGDGVPDERAAADGVHHLRERRAHPGALARGEDDDGGRTGVAHVHAPWGRGQVSGASRRDLDTLLTRDGRGSTTAARRRLSRVGQGMPEGRRGRRWVITGATRSRCRRATPLPVTSSSRSWRCGPGPGPRPSPRSRAG